MSAQPKIPTISKPLQFFATTGLAALIAGIVFTMRYCGASADNISLTMTITTVGSLLLLTKRYGTKSIPVFTLMFWVLAAFVAIIFVSGN